MAADGGTAYWGSSVTILITGATGFIGRRLTQSLLDRGFLVRAAVRTLDPLLNVQQVLVPQIATEFESWRPLVKGCDTVVHLIARVHILDECHPDPLSAFRAVNVEILRACALAAAHEGIRRFILVSSIGVHGNASSTQPISVTDQLAPCSSYAISKAEAELALCAVAVEHGMQWTIIRPPLVYGAGAPGNMQSMMLVLSKRIPLPLACVTDNRRSFVAIDNLVDLLTTCLNHPAAANQVFLVSDGEDISTADLLQRLGRAMDRPALLFPVSVAFLWVAARLMGKSDMAQRLLGSLQVDIEHTRSALAWNPPLSVDEGLRRATEGFLP